jgi:ketosteroid isomerase-like protein
MSLDPVALVRRYHAALDPYDAAAVGRMFAADAVYSSPGLNGRIEGRDAIIAAFSAYFAEHPDQRAEDDSIEQTGPREARARWRLRATAASTGAPVTRRGIETVSFEAGGLIVRVEVEDR